MRSLLVQTFTVTAASLLLFGCGGKQKLKETPQHTTARLGLGENCSARGAMCEDGLFCRQSVPKGEQFCYETREAGPGEACGTIAGLVCQEGLVCVVEGEQGFDSAGLCRDAEDGAEEEEAEDDEMSP